MKVRYLRNHTEDGKLVNTGGLTVVYTINTHTVSVGYALCSDKDSFNKKIGKSIATVRLFEKPVHISKELVFELFSDNLNIFLSGLNKRKAEELLEDLQLRDLNDAFLIDVIVSVLKVILGNEQ